MLPQTRLNSKGVPYTRITQKDLLEERGYHEDSPNMWVGGEYVIYRNAKCKGGTQWKVYTDWCANKYISYKSFDMLIKFLDGEEQAGEQG